MSYLNQQLKPLSILILVAVVYASICSATHQKLHNSTFPSVAVQNLSTGADQHHRHQHQSQDENSPEGAGEDCCVSVLTTGKSNIDSLLNVMAFLAPVLLLFVFFLLQRPAVIVRLPRKTIFAPPESLVARKVCLTC